MTDFIVGAGMVTWFYLSLTVWRWDKYESAIKGTQASLIARVRLDAETFFDEEAA